MSPSPSRKHQNVIRRLAAFFLAVESQGHGRWHPAPFDLLLDRYNVVEPDFLFIRTERLQT